MKSLFRLLALCSLLSALYFPVYSQAPVVRSVSELLPEYGIDTAMVNDTAVALAYLEGQTRNYVDLTNYCVQVRTNVQSALDAIGSYPERDGLRWMGEAVALKDYDTYEYRLRRLSEFMGRMSIRYLRLEQERIELEKEEARLRELEEARQRQEALDQRADELRDSIERHHNFIVTACEGVGVTDKAKLKELRDLYYSYRMVYIKFELTARHATEALIEQLVVLDSFQNDVLVNLLGENSLPLQIEGFKNRLKASCEKDNYDIFRSYSRVYKQTSVPIVFADLDDYAEFIDKLRTVIKIQERYMQTIELRATIAAGSDAIVQLYGKKYRPVTNSYKDVLRTVNQVPTFVTNEESLAFIDNLNEFIAAQQLYIEYYQRLEEFNQRSDSILNLCEGRFKDVASSYRDIQGPLMPIPSFKNTAGAALYEQQLRDAIEVQHGYIEVVRLREVINSNDDTINANRKKDRTLFNGYKLLRKQADLTPTFSSVERSRSFIGMLNTHVAMQNLCLEVFEKRNTIEINGQRITHATASLRNIQKAYSRMMKVFDDFDEITTLDEMRRYSRQCDYTIGMQEAFLRVISGEDPAAVDSRLYRESDIEKIKSVIGM